jgi:hypothetical protein
MPAYHSGFAGIMRRILQRRHRMTHLEQNRCPPDEILLKPFYPFLQINAPTRLREMRPGSAMSQAPNECLLLIDQAGVSRLAFFRGRVQYQIV